MNPEAIKFFDEFAKKYVIIPEENKVPKELAWNNPNVFTLEVSKANYRRNKHKYTAWGMRTAATTTEDGFFVVDIDKDSEKKGLGITAWNELMMKLYMSDDPSNYCSFYTRTPSGGLHLYYKFCYDFPKHDSFKLGPHKYNWEIKSYYEKVTLPYSIDKRNIPYQPFGEFSEIDDIPKDIAAVLLAITGHKHIERIAAADSGLDQIVMEVVDIKNKMDTDEGYVVESAPIYNRGEDVALDTTNYNDKQLELIVDNIPVKYAEDRVTWINGLRIFKRLARRDLAIRFSKLATAYFNEEKDFNSPDSTYETMSTSVSINSVSLGTVFHWIKTSKSPDDYSKFRDELNGVKDVTTVLDKISKFNRMSISAAMTAGFFTEWKEAIGVLVNADQTTVLRADNTNIELMTWAKLISVVKDFYLVPDAPSNKAMINGVEFKVKNNKIPWSALFSEWKDKLLRSKFVFAPQGRKVLANEFNLFTRYKATKIDVDDWSPIQIIIDHIREIWCNGDDNLLDYIISWFAHPLQTGTKTETAIVLKGDEGTGKGLIVEKLMTNLIYGKQYVCQVPALKLLAEKFNADMGNKILVVLSEAEEQSSKSEISSAFDIIKDLITNDSYRLESKGKDAITIESIHNLIITTNHLRTIYMSNSDRRYTVLECSDKYIDKDKPENEAYFDKLADACNNQYIANMFYTYLLNYKITKSVRKCINTAAKQEIKDSFKTDPVLMFIDEAFTVSTELVNTMDIYNAYVSWCQVNRIPNNYLLSVPLFTKKLKANKVIGERKCIRDGEARVWVSPVNKKYINREA